MRPSMLKECLTSMVKLKRTTLIEGSPGLGKTQVCGQVAKDLWSDPKSFIPIHAPLMQPEDYGMPVTNKDRTRVDFIVPNKFPMEGNEGHPDEGIILIDELPQADNAGQKILANFVQEREIHGQKLKPGWAILATGNRQSDRAGANRLLSHLRARVTTLEFEPNLDDWTNWAIDHGIDDTVISFLRFKTALLMKFDPQVDINPTPRAWAEGVSPVIGNVPRESEFECFKGAVGEGPAAEFMAFLKIARKLPNPDVVLMNPDKAEVPTDPSTLYAISGAIGARATADNFERVAIYSKRLPPEFMVLIVRDAVRRDKEIQRTKVFTQLAAKELSKVIL